MLVHSSAKVSKRVLDARTMDCKKTLAVLGNLAQSER